ncbi:hypothetical protein Pan54_25530 [Rubinisphaera italica]|uniref:Prepilin-type N-terminal cleavage/methylation domain-containing protein n=2 Tax=Rubinisphaera italica TaxID=2527969 RepID=A0A5C5XFD7_9PLAN|nr:hypothetical protein Pan54_25530 [Rubinisphaera italica]
MGFTQKRIVIMLNSNQDNLFIPVADHGRRDHGGNVDVTRRSGFTLTEMLVAVGLLLVIMLIFSQIFSLAVTAMTRQKGLANNDQRARTAFTVLDADLKRMSYRSVPGQGGVVPLVPGLRYNGEASATEQQGYIYYSENDPNLDTDDVLQFTVDASVTGKYPGAQRYAGQNVLPYYGRGASLDNNTGRRDQPDWDDGTPGDNVGSSEQAEVAYFLRNGTLYRRVCLLRNNKVGVPINMAQFDQGNQTALAQPGYLPSSQFDDGGTFKDIPFDMMRSFPAAGNFYTSFDYSAHYATSPYDAIISTIVTNVAPPTYGTPLAVFHGSLSNSATDNWPLGVPHFRFGFNNDTNTNPNMRGRPREYIAGTLGTAFHGRYTHEETSNLSFKYPQTLTGNVFAKDDFDIATFRATGRVPAFANGSRRGADILMSNVHSFDVQVWDANAFGGVGGFVNIGDGNSVDFAPAARLNGGSTGYGSIDGIDDGNPVATNGNNVLDTWHSVADINTTLGLQPVGTGQAPFVPKLITTTIDDWMLNTTYNVGDIVVPSNAYRTNPANNYSRVNRAVYYRCVFSDDGAGNPGQSDATELANWPTDVLVGPIAEANGEIQWQIVDNRKPIRALRVIIRFIDPLSRQLRQVTMVHSLNEDDI